MLYRSCTGSASQIKWQVGIYMLDSGQIYQIRRDLSDIWRLYRRRLSRLLLPGLLQNYNILQGTDHRRLCHDHQRLVLCVLPPGETKYLRQDGTQFTGLSWYSITLGVVHILYGVCIYLDYST